MFKDVTFATVVDAVIALAVIAASTVLLALHDISESTSLALYGVAITLIGGSGKALLALRTPPPSQPAPPAPPVG